MNKSRFHISFALQICLISICLVATTASFFGYQSYHAEASRKADSLARELLSVVKTAAIQLDIDAHEEIYYDSEDGLQGQGEFDQVNRILVAIRDSNQLTHGHGSPVYTLRKSFEFDDTAQLEFVVMSDVNDSGHFYAGAQLPVEPFQITALDGKPDVTGIYHDSEGAWISAAAPLFQDGEVVGIIQADRTIDFYFEELALLKQQYILNGLVCIVFGVLLSWLFSVYATRPLKTLLGATEVIGSGDYSFQITEHRIDDFEYVFQDFNRMARKIGSALEENIKKAQEIGELNASLEHSLKEVEKSLAVKNEFLANMSHEIRTPMNAIIGFNRVLLRKIKDADSISLLHRVGAASDNLMRIVNQILDLSKIESGKMELDNADYDLYKELADLVMMNGEKAAERNIDLILDIPVPLPPVIFGDGMRTSEVVLNLLSNAIKFTHEGYVRLLVTWEQRETEIEIHCEVSDTGIGMTEAACQNIFNAFTQADSSVSKAYGGTGLGLTIAKDIAIQMCGDITVKSAEDKGTTFTATLKQKMSTSQDVTAKDSKSSNSGLKKRRFLVIDDCPLVNDLIQKWFEENEISARFATSIQEAGEQYRESTHQGMVFDAVLLDWPMEGNDVAKSRKVLTEQGINLPLFIMMPFGLAVDIDRSLYDAMIAKPLIQQDLFDILARCLEQGPTQTAVATTEAQPDLPGTARRLLLVEDDINNQLLAGFFLDDYGIEYDLAQNGQEAIDRVAGCHYDVVLMDVQMPIMDGLTATARIRENHNAESLPIIALTANSTPNDRKRCANVGMNEFIAKPVDVDRLYQALDYFLKRGTVPAEQSTRTVATPTPAKIDDPLDQCLPETTFQNKKVLLVEDESNNQLLATFIFEDLGVDFAVANHGQEALDLLAKDEFDLVFMDMQMPVMDGITATRAIRADDRYQNLPVIAMTANASMEHKAICLDAGMNTVVTKPIEVDRLIEVMNRYLTDGGFTNPNPDSSSPPHHQH